MSAEAHAIPDDIVKKASDICRSMDIASTVGHCFPIMNALLDERKRCAAVAKHATMATGAPLEQMGDEVAAAVLAQPETQKFWMVYGVGTRGPTYQHFSKAAAQSEAQRLAALHPETMFVVLAAVDAYATEKPALVRFKLFKSAPLGRDADDDIPF